VRCGVHFSNTLAPMRCSGGSLENDFSTARGTDESDNYIFYVEVQPLRSETIYLQHYFCQRKDT
jgi:hypothetical protein